MTATTYIPKGKFSAGDLGNAAAVRSYPEGDKTELPLGSVIGKCTGIMFRFNPNNPEQPSVALEGYFEGIPSEEGASVIRSTTFFPPTTVAKMVQAYVLKGEAIPTGARGLKRGQSVSVDIGEAIPIAMEVRVRKTATAIGYEFITEMVGGGKMESEDLLADVRALLPKTARKALPAPTSNSVASKKKRR